MNEEKKPFLSLLVKNGKRWPLLVLALAGIALLLFGRTATAGKDDDYDARAEEYRQRTESTLTDLCRQVRGVGKAQVFVTLECGEEYVYAKDRNAGGEDYVVKSGNGLLLYRRTPTVAGVAVVCQGGDDPAVQNELARLLHATLGIPYSRICISSRKQE